jgi:hypothetical protein
MRWARGMTPRAARRKVSVGSQEWERRRKWQRKARGIAGQTRREGRRMGLGEPDASARGVTTFADR